MQLLVAGIGAALLALGFAGSAVSAAGGLDGLFGNGGSVIDTSRGPILGMVVQPDGKIVTVGIPAAGIGFSVARYLTDGSLDPSFGSGGRVNTPFGGTGEVSSGVALQPDGKIVVVGQTIGDLSVLHRIAMARYNADGSLDGSFGAGGKVVTTLIRDESASAVAVQPDGKLVVAGFRLSGPTGPDMIVLRYTSSGAIDPTFANGSLHSLDFGGAELAFGLGLQADGKVVIAGSTSAGGRNAFAVARYNTDGSLDPGFGSGGKLVTTFGGQESRAVRLLVQPDGKILVAGVTVPGGGTLDFALVRYASDGSLDPSFGLGGEVVSDFGGTVDDGVGLALQPDGRILLSGASGVGRANDFALARYEPDGTLDSSFGAGGRTTTDFGGVDLADVVAVEPDGKIVLAGGTSVGGVNLAIVARYFAAPPDATPPVISVPSPIVVDASSSNGAAVSFSVTAFDPDDAVSTPACTQLSGGTFAIGSTTVTCTAADGSGNVASASFAVTVRPVARADRYVVTSGGALTVGAPGVVGNDVFSVPATAAVVRAPASGVLTLSVDGSFTYEPSKGFVGTDAFDYVVTSAGAGSTAATVTLSVTARGADCQLGDYPRGKDGGLDLRGATLGGCYLAGVDLAAVNLVNASLVGADLAGADLTGSRLGQANFARAILTGANLANANLSGATLTGATMTGANLIGAVWSKTTCPDGTSSTANGGTCVGHLG